MSRPRPDPVGPGQRSVWDFPRPPAIEPEARPIRIEHGGVEIARSERAIRVLETSHPYVYYLPPEDVRGDLLERAAGGSMCEWKGRATYFDVRLPDDAGGLVLRASVFCYERPTARFADCAGWLSFYNAPFGACWVGDERATPQPGGFYSGWITGDLAGPFKGAEGSSGW